MANHIISKGEKERKFLEIKENKICIFNPMGVCKKPVHLQQKEEKCAADFKSEKFRETGSPLLVICRKTVYN